MIALILPILIQGERPVIQRYMNIDDSDNLIKL